MSTSALGRDLATLRIDRSRGSSGWSAAFKVLAVLLLLAVVGGGAAAAYHFRDRLQPLPLVKTECLKLIASQTSPRVTHRPPSR